MVKKTIAVVILLLSGILLVYFNIKRTQEPIPEYVFTYAENQPEGYPTTLGGNEFARLVKERTNGRIKIIVLADGELGDEQAVVKQLTFGGIDFTRASLSSLAEAIPKLNVLQMPYLYKNSEHMWKVLDGEIGDFFMNELDGSGLIALSWYDAGARNFYTLGKPITCLEDMKGIKIRVQESELMANMVEALGATAVPMVYAEVYSALEKGTIDGAENNWPSYESMGHNKVAPYYTVDEHTRVPELQLCSQATWEKLSEEDREIIKQCARESALYERRLWEAREKESEQAVIKEGVEVTVLSEEEKERFREAVLDVYSKYCAEDMDIVERIIKEAED